MRNYCDYLYLYMHCKPYFLFYTLKLYSLRSSLRQPHLRIDFNTYTSTVELQCIIYTGSSQNLSINIRKLTAKKKNNFKPKIEIQIDISCLKITFYTALKKASYKISLCRLQFLYKATDKNRAYLRIRQLNFSTPKTC